MPAERLKLNDPPEDGITAVKFQPGSSQYLGVSSWDTSMRVYDIIANAQRTIYKHPGSVLDFAFKDAVQIYSGGLDSTLRMFDCNAEQETPLGQHNGPISKVHYSEEHNIIITGSWDNTVKFWDPRSNKSVSTHKQPGEVYTMDAAGDRLVVGTSSRRINIWNLCHMNQPEQQRESNLKFQTRCIRCFPNKQGYALSSIEGRVAVEFFDLDTEIQKKKYAFKCHREKRDGVEYVYPVHSMSFHQEYNTFATGGADGIVNIWDGFNRKRLIQFQKFPTSISSLSFSDDGSALAIASSYQFEDGDKEEDLEDNVYICYVSEQEVKPKLNPAPTRN